MAGDTDNTNRKPCEGCPFARHVKPGATGGSLPDRYIGQALGPFWLPCHMAPGYEENKFAPNNTEVIPQCAGAATYRANVGVMDKFPPSVLHAAPDRELVFAGPDELLAHHLQISLAEAQKILQHVTPEMMLASEYQRMRAEHLRLVPADRKPK